MLRSAKTDGLKYTVQITRMIFQSIGLWPLPYRSSTSRRISTRLLNVFCYFLYLFILVPGMLRIFLKETSARRRFKMIGPLLNCAMSVVKYTIMLNRADAIRDCIRHMKEDWQKAVRTKDDEVAMLSKAAIGRKLVLTSAVFMYGGGLSYRTILPISRGPIVINENLTIRALACPSYFVKFDEQASPAYEIVFILQFFAGFIVYSTTCGVCGLAAFCVMHLCGQLEILMMRMGELVQEQDCGDENVGKKLGVVVRHHMRVRSFLKQVEYIIEQMCLVEIMGYTSLVCICAYYILMEWQDSDGVATFTYFMVMMSFLFNIFILCYIGELLTEEGNKLAATSSAIDWYHLSAKKARCLILVIAMSNYPTKLTAGKMIDMSMSNFSSIVKTAVGYFNILRRFIM